MANPKPDKKLPAKLPGEIVPQEHGGALRRGGGNPKRNGGRPPSEIRAKMRGSLYKRLKIAEEIADSKTANDSDRLKALDFLAKYGMGTRSEVTGEDGAPVQVAKVAVHFVKSRHADS